MLGDGKAEKLCAVLWTTLQERSGQTGTSLGEALRIVRGVENKTNEQRFNELQLFSCKLRGLGRKGERLDNRQRTLNLRASPFAATPLTALSESISDYVSALTWSLMEEEFLWWDLCGWKFRWFLSVCTVPFDHGQHSGTGGCHGEEGGKAQVSRAHEESLPLETSGCTKAKGPLVPKTC